MGRSYEYVPRRNRVNEMTAAELAIRSAIQIVECSGCHPFLTDAVVLLGQAQEKVADYVDSGKPKDDA